MPPNEKEAFYAINLLRTDKDLFIELIKSAQEKVKDDEWTLEGGQKVKIEGAKDKFDKLIQEVNEKV